MRSGMSIDDTSDLDVSVSTSISVDGVSSASHQHAGDAAASQVHGRHRLDALSLKLAEYGSPVLAPQHFPLGQADSCAAEDMLRECKQECCR